MVQETVPYRCKQLIDKEGKTSESITERTADLDLDDQKGFHWKEGYSKELIPPEL